MFQVQWKFLFFLKKKKKRTIFCGYIILGCVIKGETDHYDVVKNITISKIYEFSYENNFPISNALLTVEIILKLLKGQEWIKNLEKMLLKICLELIDKINENNSLSKSLTRYAAIQAIYNLNFSKNLDDIKKFLTSNKVFLIDSNFEINFKKQILVKFF